RRLGDRVELRLARAKHWARRGGDEARKVLPKLTDNREKFAAPDQQRLLRGTAESLAQIGEHAEACRIWHQLAEHPPHDLNVQLGLCDFELLANKEAGMKRALEEVRRIEGPAGTAWRYCEARYFVWRTKQGDAQAADQARALIAALAGQRPAWSGVALCEA